MAGAAVLILFALFDLTRLQPLATPFALSTQILGPSGPTLEMPVISQVIGIAVFTGNVLSLTILHFLAFSFLGLLAVWGCENCRLPLNLVTGAILGLVVGSGVYFTCMALYGGHVLAETPGFPSVFLANLTAGALMGGYYQIRKANHSW
jgi:hypothetical protein